MISHPLLHLLAPVLFTARAGLPLAIPGPSPSRWLSTAGPLLPWAGDAIGHSSALFRRYGRVVAVARGGGTRLISSSQDCPGTVICYGAECVEQVTTQHDVFCKGTLVGALYPGQDAEERRRPLLTFGSGLFAENGDQHRRHRRLLSPAFSKKRLAGYCERMVEQTQRTIATLRVGEERDISRDLRHLTANIVSETLLGAGEGGDEEEATLALVRVLQLMGRPWTRLLPFDIPGFPFHAYLDANARLDEGMRALLEAKKATLGPSREPGDMLAALILAHDEETGTGLTDQEILGHLSVFFTAGHETSANALTWTLLLLALFPDVTANVCEELDSVLGGSPPTPESLERLQYLGYVVKESLRLFTPAPWNGRIVGEDTELSGMPLPQGTEVLLSIYETHRVAESFPEPLRFTPERWATAKPSPYEYNPFSVGPRTCIGAAFATMEVKIVLALLLQRFRVALLPQHVDRFAELVLAPKVGLKVRLEPRDGRYRASAARLTGNVFDMVQLPLHAALG